MTPNEQKKKMSQNDPKKSDKIRVERFGDVGLKYITLGKKRSDTKGRK